jgi:hypothetical protein
LNNTGKYFGFVHDSSSPHSMEARFMRINTATIFRSVIISVFICLFAVLNLYGGAYEALKGLNYIKVVFDFRAKAPQSAWIYLDLIHKIFNDKSIREVTDKLEICMYAANLMGLDRQQYSLKLNRLRTAGYP